MPFLCPTLLFCTPPPQPVVVFWSQKKIRWFLYSFQEQTFNRRSYQECVWSWLDRVGACGGKAFWGVVLKERPRGMPVAGYHWNSWLVTTDPRLFLNCARGVLGSTASVTQRARDRSKNSLYSTRLTALWQSPSHASASNCLIFQQKRGVRTSAHWSYAESVLVQPKHRWQVSSLVEFLV